MSIVTQRGSLTLLKDRLTSFLSDIHDLQNGKMPRSLTLSVVPTVDRWSYGLVPTRCIVGSIREHPILGNHTRVHTSEVVLVDPENRWARTWSGYHRLGAPEQIHDRSKKSATVVPE